MKQNENQSYEVYEASSIGTIYGRLIGSDIENQRLGQVAYGEAWTERKWPNDKNVPFYEAEGASKALFCDPGPTAYKGWKRNFYRTRVFQINKSLNNLTIKVYLQTVRRIENFHKFAES